MQNLYYFVHSSYSGNGAVYGDYRLTKERPKEDLIEVPLYLQELTNEQLVALVDQMLAEVPSGRVVVVSRSQVYYLFENHPFFKPEVPNVE